MVKEVKNHGFPGIGNVRRNTEMTVAKGIRIGNIIWKKLGRKSGQNPQERPSQVNTLAEIACSPLLTQHKLHDSPEYSGLFPPRLHAQIHIFCPASFR